MLTITLARLRPRLVMALLPGLFVPFLSTAARDDEDEPPEFVQVMALYGRCEWAQAFEKLARLADHGDREAARVALLMRAHGPRLFGETFVVDLERRRRWVDAATRPAQDP